MRPALWTALCLTGLLASVQPTAARIKLTALPARETSSIRLDNASATLIEEERTLTLQKGLNQVDFSWKGVSIDMDSIRLLLLSHPDKVKMLNVSYPPGEPALVWQIYSPEAWEENVRIAYLLRNIDRLVEYKAVASRAETDVALKSYVILRNFSGENFDNTRIFFNAGSGFEQSIQHEETKQILTFDAPGVPITKIWKFDSALQPWDPEKEAEAVGIPVSYRIVNAQSNKLGKAVLWNGKVRVFQDDGHGSTIILGEDQTAATPIGEKTDLYIGDSRDIVVTQRKMQEKMVNARRNDHQQVILHDMDELIEAKIENFKDTPAVLTMVQHISGQWDMDECNLAYTRKDAETLEFEIPLPARGKQTLSMNYIRRNIRPTLPMPQIYRNY
jgi:hypothetical protein